MTNRARCSLVLPCRNEANALRHLLPTVDAEFEVVVVDNGSDDGTADVARAHGARVIHEPSLGYGSAVHAGVLAARREFVAVLDGDGSFAVADVDPLLAAVISGRADLATGRRRPTADARWPWHARCGNALIAWMMRRQGIQVHDIGPMRVCRRQALLDLGVTDRQFGYPFELLRRAAASGWQLREYDVTYGPRASGTRSKVSGSIVGTARVARDLAKVIRRDPGRPPRM